VANELDQPVVSKHRVYHLEHLDVMADRISEKEAQDLERDGYLIRDLGDEKS
jgi:hypothetical protein